MGRITESLDVEDATPKGAMVQFLRLTTGMNSGERPAKSGLPELETPSRAPKSGAQRFFLAVVLHIISGRSTSHVSQRELQERLNRAGRDPIKTHLHDLRTGRYLKRLGARRSYTDADRYAVGSHLTGVHKAQWVLLANRLFGKAGICKGLLGRAAFGTGFLGANGMLVLGTLRRSRRPLTVGELHRYLDFFIASEQTIRARLKALEGRGLVTQDGPLWTTHPDVMSRLTTYEESFGSASRKNRTAHRHKAERKLQLSRLHKGVLTPRQKETLRQSGCIRCRRSNEECLKAEGAQLTIEHFPPQRWLKHWGLDDHPHFNWAICPSGNSHYGGQLKGVRPPALDKSIQVVARDREALSPIVGATLEVQLRRFYQHLDNGDKRAAALAAKRAASLWRALVLETWRADVTDFDGNQIDIRPARSRRRVEPPTRRYLSR